MSQTFVMIKPDAVKRGLIGEIISRFEKRCFVLVNMRIHCVTLQDAERLYAEHKGKHFYDRLVQFTAAPVVVMILHRHDAVAVGRQLVEQIRSEFADQSHLNCVHASDSEQAFLRESAVFFPQAKEFE